MVKLVVVTPKGELVNDEFEMVTAKGDQGEMGFLERRLPIIIKITNGFVKGTKDKETIFVSISNGILDNNNSKVTVLAEDACTGETLEEAFSNMENLKLERANKNKKSKFNFVEAEKDLVKAIRDSKASNL